MIKRSKEYQPRDSDLNPIRSNKCDSNSLFQLCAVGIQLAVVTLRHHSTSIIWTQSGGSRFASDTLASKFSLMLDWMLIHKFLVVIMS